MDESHYVAGEPALDYLLRSDTTCRVYEEKLRAQGRDPAIDPLARTRRHHFAERLAAVAPDIRREVERRVAERDTPAGRLRWLQERCERIVIEEREDRELHGFWVRDQGPTLRALRREIRALRRATVPDAPPAPGDRALTDQALRDVGRSSHAGDGAEQTPAGP